MLHHRGDGAVGGLDCGRHGAGEAGEPGRRAAHHFAAGDSIRGRRLPGEGEGDGGTVEVLHRGGGRRIEEPGGRGDRRRQDAAGFVRAPGAIGRGGQVDGDCAGSDEFEDAHGETGLRATGGGALCERDRCGGGSGVRFGGGQGGDRG